MYAYIVVITTTYTEAIQQKPIKSVEKIQMLLVPKDSCFSFFYIYLQTGENF
jgi:hypothetical protein